MNKDFDYFRKYIDHSDQNVDYYYTVNYHHHIQDNVLVNYELYN